MLYPPFLRAMETVHIALAVAPVFLQAAVLLRLWRSGLFRRYHVFFAFVVFDLCSSAVLIPLWRMGPAAYAAFFYAYWAVQAIGALLSFAVLWEIYRAALGAYEGLRRLMDNVFSGMIVVLLLISVVLAAWEPAAGPSRTTAAIMVLARSVHLVQAGLLLVLLLLKAELGLAWRHPLFGIAMGFALYATLQVVIFAVRAQAGAVADPMLRLLGPVSYNLAALTWLAYLWRPERAPTALTPSLSADLLRWDRALTEVWQR